MPTVTADIATDLLTPLGAYLRLRGREGTRGTFLLESVERGRLGRYSFVGCGSRLVSFAEAEALAEPVVGYVPYDYVATLEPTSPRPSRSCRAEPGRAVHCAGSRSATSTCAASSARRSTSGRATSSRS
jgi:hypothetical protein